jgi:hypothetical protein
MYHLIRVPFAIEERTCKFHQRKKQAENQNPNQSKLDDRLQRSRKYSSRGLRLLYSVLVIDSTSSTSSNASPRCELKFDVGYVSSSTQSGSLVDASVSGFTLLVSSPFRKLSIYFKLKIN